MDKSFTLTDIQHYLLEINLLENKPSNKVRHSDGPNRMTIQNLLRYSSALNILKTSTVGNIYQLTN
jgi:hypothetical protein